MPVVPFTRPTVIAAVALIDRSLSQASFNHMVLRLGLENEIISDTSISVSKKADLLGRIVVQRPADPIATLEGPLSLTEAVSPPHSARPGLGRQISSLFQNLT
jgi:hypothetical protein